MRGHVAKVGEARGTLFKFQFARSSFSPILPSKQAASSWRHGRRHTNEVLLLADATTD